MEEQNQRQALERAMKSGLELGITTTTNQGLLFTEAILGSDTLATEIPQAIAQIQSAGLEANYQAALQEINVIYHNRLEREKAVRDHGQIQHQKLEQELAIDSLLDKAFEQAIRGKLELKLLEGKQLNLRQSNRWETILNKNIQQKIAIKAKAERDSQPKPPPKPKPTRFLSTVDNAPRVGSMVAFEGNQVMITSLSETPWEFNSRQLEDQALAEFAGQLVTYVYYQPVTEDELETARVSSSD